MVILPTAASSVMGAVFFLCDYVYQADVTSVSGMWSTALLKYLCAVVLFWMVQYCGYLFLKWRVAGKYACGRKNFGRGLRLEGEELKWNC